MQANTTSELFHHLSVISEDAGLLQKALKYLRRLASEKEEREEDGRLSKEEYIEKIHRAEAEVECGDVTRIENEEQLSSWLESL